MPRSTRLEKLVVLSLRLVSLAPALSACTFGGGDGKECNFEFQELCELNFSGTKTFNSQTIDTSVNSSCSVVVPADEKTGSPELCVVSAATIEIAAGTTLRAIGSRPLVLAASENVNVFGTIDASSKRATTTPVVLAESLGAGAESVACSSFGRATMNNPEGASGGAGGSFRGAGGNGGDGNVEASRMAGGQANSVTDTTKLTAVRGGCRGQDGGSSTGFTGGGTGGAGGVGGAGGGSIYLVAKKSVQILNTGAIAVNGAGGTGGAVQAGGGGGGTGGLIVLEAPMIIRVGKLTANGGGGGEGGFSSGVTGTPGAPGADGLATADAAAGGNDLIPTGNGAAGAANNFNAALSGTESGGGGGGGGGGVGWIHTVTKGPIGSGGGVSSPPAE